jgi:hypothetical protein
LFIAPPAINDLKIVIEKLSESQVKEARSKKESLVRENV